MPTPSNLVLIGTAQTLPSLSAAVGASADAPEPVGAVLFRREGVEVANLLGLVDDLPVLKERYGITSALVCLPASMSGALARLRALLGELDITVYQTPYIAETLTA